MEEQMRPVRIFICYAHEDREHVKNLLRHLATLRRLKKADIWYDGEILPGATWKKEIADRLNAADIVVLLVSSYFFDSSYCYETEMKRALERHEADQIQIIPIITSHVDIVGTPFSTFQMLPAEAKPVIEWTHEDEAYAYISMQLRLTVERVVTQRLLPKEEQVSLLDAPQPIQEGPIIETHVQEEIRGEASGQHESVGDPLNDPVRLTQPVRDPVKLTQPVRDPVKLTQPIKIRRRGVHSLFGETPIQGGLSTFGETPIQGGIRGEAPNNSLSLTQTQRNFEVEGSTGEDALAFDKSVTFIQRLFQVFGKQKKGVLGITAPDPTPREQITAPDPTLFPTHQRPGPTDLFPSRQRPGRSEPSYPSVPKNPGPPLVEGYSSKIDGQPDIPSIDHAVINPNGEPSTITYKGHSDEVIALSWSPDGRYIASGGSEIHIWSVLDGAYLRKYKGHHHGVRAIKWFADSKYIASADDYELQIWNITTAKHICTISSSLKGNVPPFDISPNGLQVVMGKDIYNPFTGRLLSTINIDMESISTIAWSPDGQSIAFASKNKIAVFSFSIGKIIDEFISSDESEALSSETNTIIMAAWSANGVHIAFGGTGRVVQLWTPHFPQIPDSSGRRPGGPGAYMSILSMWNENIYRGHTEAIAALVWCPTNTYIASLSKDNVIQVWDPMEWSVLHIKKDYPCQIGNYSLAWSPNGTYIASISEGMIVEIWRAFQKEDKNIRR